MRNVIFKIKLLFSKSYLGQGHFLPLKFVDGHGLYRTFLDKSLALAGKANGGICLTWPKMPKYLLGKWPL